MPSSRSLAAAFAAAVCFGLGAATAQGQPVSEAEEAADSPAAPEEPAPAAGPPGSQATSAVSEQVATPEQDTGPGRGALYKLTLTDGQELRGRVVAQGEVVILELVDGHRLQIPAGAIRELLEEGRMTITERGELWFEDPNRTRYLFGPSAMRLRQGEAYFSQKELVFSSFAYGLHDNVSLEVGTVIPAWFVGASGMNFVVGAKAGGSLGERFHLAAGGLTLMLPGVDANGPVFAGFLFGSATYGGPNAHATLSLGRPFMLGNDRSELGDFIITASGNLRVAKNFALVTENWLMPSLARSEFVLVNGVAVRVMGEKIAVDVGLLLPFTQRGLQSEVPIPWLDFTYNF
jgi:hypothetical protein